MDGRMFILLLISFVRGGESLTETTNDCGMLKIREPAFKNKDVAIYFQLSIRYSLDDVAYINWKFFGRGKILSITNSSNKHSLSRLNATFFIVIKQADNDDQGLYFPQIMDKLGNIICYSNAVTLSLQDPPRDIRFTSPNKSLSGCEECLYAEYNHKLEVECSFTNGSEEESVVIQLDSMNGTKTTGSMTRLSRGRYAAAFNYLKEYNHLANVTCQVTAPDLPQPLTVTSKLYVLRRPDTPILTVGFLTDGHSPNVSCQSDNSRPPPKLFYKLEEQTIDVNQTNESYIDKNTGNSKYRSIASIHSLERSWNNKMITCCLRHETLESPLCSEAMTLHYEFPPSAVHLSFTNIFTTTKQNGTINVTCVVVNANPVCGAIISVNDVEISNVNVSHKQDAGGMTTVVIASMNVVPEDDGKRVTCAANCSIFATNQTDSVFLELRDDSLVTSQDQNQMIVLIVVPVVAVILLGTLVVVIVVCVRRRNVARQETYRASSTEPEGYYQTLNRAEVGQSSIYTELQMNVCANDK